MFLPVKFFFSCTSVLGYLTIRSFAQDEACPLPEESIPLTNDLSIRAVRDPANGALRVEMTSALGGWIGFAFADSETMVGNTAAIGQVGIDPGWYDLTGKSVPQVVLRANEALQDANLEVTDAGTIFSFTVPLDSADESDVGYIFAAGASDTLAYHDTRGFQTSAFGSCASTPAVPEEPSPPGPDAPVPTETPQAPAPEPTETTAAPVVAPTQPTAPAPTSSGRSVLNQKGWFVTSLSIVVVVVMVAF